MDYVGQGKAEFLYQAILLTFTILGIGIAYYTQYFSYAFYMHGAGFVAACIICLPPWPAFKRNPVKWRPDYFKAQQQKQEKQLEKSKKEA